MRFVTGKTLGSIDRAAEIIGKALPFFVGTPVSVSSFLSSKRPMRFESEVPSSAALLRAHSSTLGSREIVIFFVRAC